MLLVQEASANITPVPFTLAHGERHSESLRSLRETRCNVVLLDHSLCLACDMPFVKPTLLRFL